RASAVPEYSWRGRGTQTGEAAATAPEADCSSHHRPTCCLRWDAWYWVIMEGWFRLDWRQFIKAKSIIRPSPNGPAGFERVWVSGASLAPRPPARTKVAV